MLDIRTTADFDCWIKGLRDVSARARIVRYFERIQNGEKLAGDLKPVGGHVVEARFSFGPGYRVYLTQRNRQVILLLAGGDKSSQRRDIERAKELARQWRNDARDE
ncbi:MAG: type II toxin-antitoxin system RelE/ParE family toxin [Olsenella sp.]|nr:type II toxin-antitoxin system RelE/ParE family toxin [Olsenella sp.]